MMALRRYESVWNASKPTKKMTISRFVHIGVFTGQAGVGFRSKKIKAHAAKIASITERSSLWAEGFLPFVAPQAPTAA